MYRSIGDFLRTWKTEEDATLKIFTGLNDESLQSSVSEEVRTLGRLAWHITQTLTEMNSKVGLLDNDDLADLPIPSKVKEIIEVYEKYSSLLAKNIKSRWNDEMLSEKMELYGENWERSRILEMLVNHQIHHRAQMTILMRLLGLQVPGIYGPSKEEWKNYGMEPQE
ncbi:MAG: DinB family protein [Melioribacteraceae bacterium]|nr:DinB family protein [Melioribacteraceae bacterium]MCO6473843.1 DinB family protein [Melioribacteraceae bacterium]MDD3559574.1 DinB family protein [Melioribacteraceae bacterium]